MLSEVDVVVVGIPDPESGGRSRAVIRAWFKNACFRVTSGLTARNPIVPTLERVYGTILLP